MPSSTFELKTEIVRAGAGAGKTTQLTERVLSFVLDYLKVKSSLPRIVVTTFTKKATQELRERLTKRAFEIGDPKLIQFVNSKSNLHISTIHGVLSLFLRRYGIWMGMDSGFSILDSESSRKGTRRQIRNVLVQRPNYVELLESYSVEQIIDITEELKGHFGRSAEIKPADEVKVWRAGISSLELILKELLEVAKSIQSEAQDQKWQEYGDHICSLSESFLENLSRSTNPKDSFKLELENFIEGVKERKKPSFLKKKPPVSEETDIFLKDVLDEIKKINSEEYSLETLKEYVQLSNLVFEFVKYYLGEDRTQKSELGVLDLSELEGVSRELIFKYPEIANAFSSDWDFWLVDEFQDTSPIQIEILDRLIGDKPTYYVGDPQQSIYLFRGARSQIFSEKELAVVENGGHTSKLLKNYRSDPRLLLFFNEFFSKLGKQFSKMEPRQPIEEIEKADRPPVVANIFISSKEDPEPYRSLVNLINKGIESGGRYDHFCILARTNSELSEIAQALESEGLPTQIHSADGFYSRREIIDVASILKFLVNPFDNVNLIRLLRSPWFKIEDGQLAQVLKKRPIFYWLEMQRELVDDPGIQKLKSALDVKDQSGYYFALVGLIRSQCLLDASYYLDSTGRRESNIWKFLMKLKEAERQPGFQPNAFVQSAFSGVRSVEGDEEWDAVAALEPNRIHLMTIHKSKGLKFKNVIIPNLHKRPMLSSARGHSMLLLCDEDSNEFVVAMKSGEDQKMQHCLLGKQILNQLSNWETEEQLRLLYVAMTRAESTVTLHWQDKIASGSLASKIKISTEEGLHSFENYSIFVQKEFEILEKNKAQSLGSLELREPWSNITPSKSGFERVSVSTLVDNQFSEFESLKVKPNGSNNFGANVEKKLKQINAPILGQKLHAALESLKYSGDFDGHKNKLEDIRLKKAIRFTVDIKNPPMRDLISSGQVEWGFQLKISDKIIEGQIDLWGEAKDENDERKIWIIDYKSGSSRSVEAAFAQLNLYSLAVRAVRPGIKVNLAVIFSLEEKVEIRPALAEKEIFNRFSLN